ncbi:flap endonuclease-1 [Candidatus Woesearchaeota archaeon]|nr:flap endonuclease-1 [Candidatus Woesearchaeota archaeon]
MGLNIKDLIVKKEIAIKDLKDKIVVVDSMNLLYQFLTTIRSQDGTVLTDSQGKVTSHLIGLFSRTTALMEEGLKLAFVFDGKAPEIKRRTWEKRAELKKEASLKLKEAEEEGNVEDMRKFASRTAILTKEMVQEAKNLLGALGLPVIQAPSEGEAQAAYMVKKGNAYAAVSQDYDCLMFGCPLLVRNLSIAGKRRKTGTLAYQTVKPETIELKEFLQNLNLTLDQLIVLAILIGTDYNPGGIKGIGPKNALKLLKEFGTDFDDLFTKVAWGTFYPDLSWKEVFNTIKDIPTTDNYELKWKAINEEEVYHLLVKEHNFGEERVKNKLEALREVNKKLSQKGLGSFF